MTSSEDWSRSSSYTFVYVRFTSDNGQYWM